LPFSHASNGKSNSSKRKYGWAKAIFDLRFTIYDLFRFVVI
jgi:hypothetical protein